MNSKTFHVTDMFAQFLLIVAAVFLLLVVVSYFRGKSARVSLREAAARVSEVRSETIQAKDEKGELREQGPFRIVYVEFKTNAGIKTSARLKYVLSSGVGYYPIGSTVPIQYNPEFSDQIREVSFFEKHGLELFFGVLGAVFLLGALLIAWLSKDLVFPVSGSMTQIRIAEVCFFLGLVIVGFAMKSFYVQNSSSGYEQATATVTGFESVKSNRAHYDIDDIYPVLRFQTSQGRMMTVRSQSQIDHARDREGARYQVTYSTRDPAIASPAADDRPIGGVVFLIFVGLFPLGVGGAWLLQLLRH
ncbi:DUF3592 domain-containing protein [Bdellovibrionota bacterium FG-2]